MPRGLSDWIFLTNKFKNKNNFGLSKLWLIRMTEFRYASPKSRKRRSFILNKYLQCSSGNWKAWLINISDMRLQMLLSQFLHISPNHKKQQLKMLVAWQDLMLSEYWTSQQLLVLPLRCKPNQLLIETSWYLISGEAHMMWQCFALEEVQMKLNRPMETLTLEGKILTIYS